jgi:hypothetical protein
VLWGNFETGVMGVWMFLDDRSKTGFLWELPGATERLQIFKAELLEEGTFDDAVSGVHTVFHTACPVLYDPDGDPEVLNAISFLPPPFSGLPLSQSSAGFLEIDC